MKCRSNDGFSLVEMLVSIVILGLITIPLTSGMVLAMKTIAKSENMMKAQLAVSSAVETLMADGISGESTDYRPEEFSDVTIQTTLSGDATYYDVVVTSDLDETVTVTTSIRKAGGTG